MAKILKNQTVGGISIIDTGVTVPGSGQYTIPAQDYLLWAASSNIVTQVGAGNIVVNDGSTDLSISDGIDLIKGLFPSKIKIQGNDGLYEADVRQIDDINRLAVDSTVTVRGISLSNILNIGFGATITSPAFPAIKPLGFYNVPAGKTLRLFGVMFKTQTPTSYLHIYQRKMMWKFGATTLSTPAAPTLTARTILGSGLTLGTYRFKIVAVNALGKTAASTEASITLTGSQNAVGLSWTAVPGALYYEIYRTAVNGATGTQSLLSTSEAVSFVDINPDSALIAATVPTSNTTTGSVDGYAYPSNYACSTAVIDTVAAITTPTALDIIYKNIYGDRKYVTATPGAAAGANVEILFGGKSNPVDDRRIPNAANSGHFIDVAINDVVSVGNTPATGSFVIYGITHYFMVSSYLANQWNTEYFETAMSFSEGEEVAFGVSSNSAVTTAARNDVILIGVLE
jgi:hypothetical protein